MTVSIFIIVVILATLVDTLVVSVSLAVTKIDVMLVTTYENLSVDMLAVMRVDVVTSSRRCW